MREIDFLDTNILVYAHDEADPRKQSIAREIVWNSFPSGSVISVQVLGELARTLLHKFRPPLPPQDVKFAIESLREIRLVSPDREMVQRAIEAHAVYGLRFWDGMIVAAAERAGCSRILSEDFNTGQTYFGVRVENPFAA
jgi:predicted nucleic acid-binding protein